MTETKLTEELLLSMGFKRTKKDIRGFPTFRFTTPKHPNFGFGRDFQVQLGEYPDSNPNCGIVSIWDRAHSVPGVRDDGKGGYEKYKLKLPELEIPIAWYVTTIERLNDIYTSITQNEPLKPLDF